MIKIDDIYPHLDFLAKRHYIFLNEKVKAGGYRAGAMISRLKQAKIDDAGNPLLVSFWEYFLRDNNKNLKKILIGRPGILQEVIADITARFPGIAFSQIVTGRLQASIEGKRVQEIFDYSGLYRSKQYCHDVYAKLEISSCPYCNEGTAKVDCYDDGDDLLNVLNHQLDHFFCQVRYPYLSLSFFNLIPACNVCNSGYKGTSDFTTTTHINPYDKSVDEHFEFYLTDKAIFKEVEVNIDYQSRIAFPNSALDDFDIKTRYNHPTVKKQIFRSYNALDTHSAKINREIRETYGIEMPLEDRLRSEERMLIFQAPSESRDILFQQYGKLKRDLFLDLELN